MNSKPLAGAMTYQFTVNPKTNGIAMTQLISCACVRKFPVRRSERGLPLASANPSVTPSTKEV